MAKELLPILALPGQSLGPTSKYAPGPGTHVQGDYIYASIIGLISESKPHKTSKTSNVATIAASKLPSLSVGVKASADTPSLPESPSSILPEVESTIYARITRLSARQANISILVINNTVCREPFTGIVRREDVRATEKDKIKMEEVFRVGDIVRGVVISLGDQGGYYVTTASNELGVVMARSEMGNGMYPVSWKEFRDPVTGVTEARKVAKPF